MSASSTAQHLVLRDGRRLCYAIYGDSGGVPLVFLHGFPGSRQQAALVDKPAAALGVRLISFDRPGFGQSSPMPLRKIPDVASDVRQLADQLGIERFGVVGVSCGGAYALACGSLLSDRITRVTLVAGMGPMDLPRIRRGQAVALRMLFALARQHYRLPSMMLLADSVFLRRFPRLALRMLSSLLSGRDRELLDGNSGLRETFVESMAEAYNQGLNSALREAHLIAGPRGYALSDVRVPVDIYQGGQDRHVPPEMGRFLAEQLPCAELHYYPGDGHLSILLSSCTAWLQNTSESATRSNTPSAGWQFERRLA